ncbi:MAG: hypothetical protein EBQ89_01595, partial [Alphaproteobacteria bacterium]|nr:hypothetical protein [Alphaproteobacteria bacterium]
SAETFIDRQGDEKIRKMKVVRSPIADVISKFLNVISLGLFKKLQDKLGYDKLYHLSLVINDDTRIEKNEQIKIDKYTNRANEEFLDIPLQGKNITIKELMDNGAKYMGENFIPYSALRNNCQDFIIGLLRGSKLSSAGIEAFIKQPVNELVDNLPGYVEKTTDVITTLGGLLTYLRELSGFKDGGIITAPPAGIIQDILDLETESESEED